MKIITTIVSLVLAFLMLYSRKGPEEKRKEKMFEVYSRDSIRIEVELIYNKQDLPEQYYSHIRTPVCKEGLCYQVEIDLYWDLLGNFVRYKVPPTKPLTKFDHEEFSKEDHQKLHSILADKRSLLSEQQVEDLIDEKTERVSEEVDGVTGATKKTVEKAVVNGAVYSTYTLWHLVNGEIAQKIPQYTAGIWNETLLRNFLRSSHFPYLYYALDHIPAQQYSDFMPDVLRIIGEGSVFVSQYAIEKLPIEILEDKAWQLELVKKYDRLPYKAQNKIVERLQHVRVFGESMNLLSYRLSEMSEAQLSGMLDLLAKNENDLHEMTLKQMIKLLDHPNRIYAEKGYHILKELGVRNKQLKKDIRSFEINN